MAGLVEAFARQIGWDIRKCNVIVEGTSDVSLLQLVARLYLEKYEVPIFGSDMAVLCAGSAEDGGVDGLNRRLHAVRQLADVDREPDGDLRHRFIGLYDNDDAGRRAVKNACGFDRRLNRCRDLFLLHPVMPLASGASPKAVEARFDRDNAAFKGLDWEMEDLVSETIWDAFQEEHPGAIHRAIEKGGRKHRILDWDGKHKLHKFIQTYATLVDLSECVKLIRCLRDYSRLRIDHLILEMTNSRDT